MSRTTIFENRAVHSLRALVLSALDGIKWRHHGIGVLQGYIREDQNPEVRVHIWSRHLLKPGMDVSGDVHDHRFSLVSHVLSGVVGHEEWIESTDPEGDHAMMALTHARAAAETQYHGPTTPLEGRFRVEKKLFMIERGYSYTFPAQRFHRSPIIVSPDDVAVTCVEKHEQRSVSARLLYPMAHPPVMAFGHTPDSSVVGLVLALAKERLSL
jgi:hypothetical protein